ncbi:hypothetical protein MHBO_002510 [Bonamia ostreae]|uniref:Uncharacterized protein n=1 Tax=Bonamia ostreae TaxID=126728 RepID=A0ABV2AMJ9_9EUKA
MNSENKKPQIRSNLSHGAEVDEYERIHSEHPYRNDYLNEMVIPDIHLDKLESKIWDERENNDDGFMREYAVSR